MTIRSTPWPAGTPCWVDISVADLDAAKQFYGAVLGWTFIDTGEDFGHYTICQAGGKNAAAISPPPPGGQPAPWTVYLGSTDAAVTAKLIADNGGTIVAEPMDIPGNGVMAIGADPTGGMFGVWQANGMVGFEIANEPGSVTWTDARLTDPDAGKAFYSAVFDYTYQAVEGAPDDYGTIHIGPGDPVGGIGGLMGAPDGTPSHWLVYFSVADIDAAARKVTEAGGSVLSPAVDTPFGRMGMYADPAGVTFSLHQNISG